VAKAVLQFSGYLNAKEIDFHTSYIHSFTFGGSFGLGSALPRSGCQTKAP
jgi:hypothetical protein